MVSNQWNGTIFLQDPRLFSNKSNIFDKQEKKPF